MRRKWFFLAPAAILGMVLFMFIGGELVLHLWNWLLPALFGWRVITFWQAIGILALSRILFGRIGGRGFRRYNFRGRMGERWARMSPEERERFRQGMRDRCGVRTPASPSTE
jgi:hypothetical protein